MICKSEDGTLIFCESENVSKPRASILIVHGFGEHLGRYEELSQFAKKQNFDVHRMDLRGHGRSNGIRGHVDNFTDYHRDIDAWIQCLENSGSLRKDLPCYLFGHSLGGLISLTYLAQRKEEPYSVAISGLILSAPALGLLPGIVTLAEQCLVRRIPRLLRTLQVPVGFHPEWLTHDKEIIEIFNEDPLVHDRVTPSFFLALDRAINKLSKTIPKIQVPVLFLLAGKDRIVNTEAAEQYAARLSQALPDMVTVKKFHGFYHEIFNETKRERAYLALKKWLQACLLQNQAQRSVKRGSSKSSKRAATERATLH